MAPRSGTSIPDQAVPVVVVLGDFAHEGLTAKIESLGFAVINKRFRSTPRNWQRIVDLTHDLNEKGRLALVFGYLPTPTLLLVAEDRYDQVRPELIAELERTRSLLFVYEDNLEGVVEPLPWEVGETPDQELALADLPWRTLYGRQQIPDREEWLRSHSSLIERAMEMLATWMDSGFEVVPFRKRSDVTIRMFEALEDAQAGVFLRLYVPHGRYQSEQLEDFLTLFTRFLRDVEGKEFSVDAERTNRGTTYVFKGRGDASTIDDLKGATTRFDSFMMLAQADDSAAERILTEAGKPRSEAGFIVAKYARSFRRLQLETRHEYERRRLVLAQQMEAEFLDSIDPATDPGAVLAPPDPRPSSVFAISGNTAPVTVNVAAGAMAHNSTVTIERVLSGGIEYGSEDLALLDLIGEISDEVQALELRSDLDRLKDPATSPEERRTGVQKLKSLVYKSGRAVGTKVDAVTTQVLVAYLNSIVTGPPR